MSKWRVSSNYIGGQKRYQVYRMLDDDELDHSGNRETVSCTFKEYDLAVMVANQMNSKEKDHE